MTQKILASSLLALALACGTSKAELIQKQSEVTAQRADLEGAKASAGPLDSFAKGLRSGGNFNPPMAFVFLSAADVARMVGEYFPYQMPARDVLGADASGNIFVRAVSVPQLLSRNRMKLTLTFDGQGVNIRNVPSLYAGEVRKAMDGLQAGVVANLDVSMVYYPRTNNVSVHVTCTDVNLRRNNDPSYRSEIRNYINTRMLQPISITVPPLNGVPAESLFVTGDHVVFGYRQ